MRIYCRIAVVMALGIASAPAARADDKADIQAVYKKLIAAFKAKDAKAIMALGTADFISKEHGTTMNAKESMKSIEEQFATTKTMKKMEMTPETIVVNGNKATVHSSYAMEAIVLDPQVKGKTHVMAGHGKMREMLVKTPQGWKFKSVETITDTMTMDGKPFQMGPPPKPKK